MSAPVRAPSVKDVARLAGVSVGTVSNVLNGRTEVSEATRRRVEESVGRLGYVRNESARQLRAGTSSVIAYVGLDTANPFFSDVAAGAEDVAYGHDMSLFLCNSRYDAQRQQTYLDRLRQQRVLGVMLTPVADVPPALGELRASGTRAVLVDHHVADRSWCSVSVDDELGGRLAADHLLDLGHRRIAFVGGPSSQRQVRDRRRGARKAARLRGDGAEILDVVLPSMDVDHAAEAGARLLSAPARGRVTAAFCGNDLVAMGLLGQCVALGVSVPDDLAVVGYDDIAFAGSASTPLTSVRQPRQELGRVAATMLLEEVREQDHEHRATRFVPELVVRRSSGG